MKEIRWNAEAAEDLEAIRDYIGRHSSYYADLVVDRIIQAVDRLREFPMSGRMVPEVEHESVREVFYADYRIIYKVVGDVVEIMTVLHGARRLNL
jgi:toxin ParE1/3/4